jgi:hypothetical protein
MLAVKGRRVETAAGIEAPRDENGLRGRELAQASNEREMNRIPPDLNSNPAAGNLDAPLRMGSSVGFIWDHLDLNMIMPIGSGTACREHGRAWFILCSAWFEVRQAWMESWTFCHVLYRRSGLRWIKASSLDKMAIQGNQKKP